MTIQYTLETPSGNKITREIDVPSEEQWYDIRETMENETGCTIIEWTIKDWDTQKGYAR